MAKATSTTSWAWAWRFLAIALCLEAEAHGRHGRNTPRARGRPRARQPQSMPRALLPGPLRGGGRASLSLGGDDDDGFLVATAHNISAGGTLDITSAVTALGNAHPQGCVLLFTPGKYLIDPPAQGSYYKQFVTPPTMTLWMEEGAVLVAAAGARVYIQGPVEAGGHQIFETTPTPVALSFNGTTALGVAPGVYGVGCRRAGLGVAAVAADALPCLVCQY